MRRRLHVVFQVQARTVAAHVHQQDRALDFLHVMDRRQLIGELRAPHAIRLHRLERLCIANGQVRHGIDRDAPLDAWIERGRIQLGQSLADEMSERVGLEIARLDHDSIAADGFDDEIDLQI